MERKDDGEGGKTRRRWRENTTAKVGKHDGDGAKTRRRWSDNIYLPQTGFHI